MSARSFARLAAPAALVAIAWAAEAQGPATRPRPHASPPASANAVATVGPLSISRADFEKSYQQGMATYRARNGREIDDEYRAPLRRQLLEVMIRQKLLELEVARRGLKATPAEAEEELRKDPAFQTRGVFDEAKFLAIKHAQPEAFQHALDALRSQLPTRRLAQDMERASRPDEAALRASVTRDLASASLEFVSLARSNAGDPLDPRETEVLAAYQAHREEFRHAEDATLSVLFVNQPPLSDAEANRPAARRAWEQQMKQRADSIVSVARGGAILDSIAAPLGGLKHDVLVSRGHFPAYWKGGSRAADAVFSAAPGTILDEPVPGASGSIVVRVDRVRPSGVAPLSDAAIALRVQLREEAHARRDQQELQALFAAMRDSLRGPAFRIRYAVADTASFTPPEPSAADIDRFYRGHLADYSWFDAASGNVVAKPLTETRSDVRERLMAQRRVALAREKAQRLFEVWAKGKRDPSLEREMTFVRETEWVPVGGVVDTGLAGAVLTDSLASHLELGHGLTTYERGLIVYHVFDHGRDIVPTFDRVRPTLVGRMMARRDAEEEAGARKIFDANPSAYASGNTLRYGRIIVPTIPPLEVRLSRADVETYYENHIDRYSAPEVVRVRHILVSPEDASPGADAAARRKAEDLLRRIRAGESFATLARENSDDTATREDGGDIGVFRRGQMLQEFEDAAFAMRPGDLAGPIRTEAGYHVMECLEHAPQEKTPLKYCYSNVGTDAATEKGGALARALADSLLKASRTPDQALAEAHRRNWLVYVEDRPAGGLGDLEELKDLKPGQFYPHVMEVPGTGWGVAWLIGTQPAKEATWEDARGRALQAYRDVVAQGAIAAKRAEMDSLEASGWSVDSLASLWGGFAKDEHVTRDTDLLGGAALLDSLVFGRSKPPVLRPGQTSGWITFPGGLARLRVIERREADPTQIATRLDVERRRAFEAALKSAYETLRRRYSVHILDDDLRATPLPEMTGS